MSIELNEENGGKMLVVHVSGKLVKEDYDIFMPEVELSAYRVRSLFPVDQFLSLRTFKRYHFRPGLQSVQIVSPGLHHSPPFV